MNREVDPYSLREKKKGATTSGRASTSTSAARSAENTKSIIKYIRHTNTDNGNTHLIFNKHTNDNTSANNNIDSKTPQTSAAR